MIACTGLNSTLPSNPDHILGLLGVPTAHEEAFTEVHVIRVPPPCLTNLGLASISAVTGVRGVTGVTGVTGSSSTGQGVSIGGGYTKLVHVLVQSNVPCFVRGISTPHQGSL
ncbi:MAG: hypothetical protein LRZ97_01320 [Candidatus Pacebacteria bacterium]|nr:hypothetical protein [Candidatus Paceibacterota bacterium]